eukprot:TRINITY_DN18527_c0_g1_i2.p1 TRINITY_DN18527_c0_g1~~TRINITY_DN18527_c0_g1_i2.p1  ORF type:complete len:576 (+),score=137.47 TRINITY_DN18527_c0_g1_i2:206-1933(+)
MSLLSSAALQDQLLQSKVGWIYGLIRDDALPWAFVVLAAMLCWKFLKFTLSLLFGNSAPKVNMAGAIDEMENSRKVAAEQHGEFDYDGWRKQNPNPNDAKDIPCWDPSTLEFLGSAKAMSPDDVRAAIERGRTAQQSWEKSSFDERRRLLSTLLRCIVENAEPIAKVACIDSGKTVVDAMVGEILVTCEKLRWTISEGEQYLKPEYRSSGLMNLHKTSRVQWTPVGVVGAIVPWNYPFHNVLNPVVAALFSGNSIVIKASEHASWSTKFYLELIHRCCDAVNAPRDLVQIVTGYGAAGNALVSGGVDTVIFVGSVEVGKKVMQAASSSLTPVILELGGKDAFIICDDAKAANLAQIACRGVYQNMGQNCAGPERFLVYEAVYDEFCEAVAGVVGSMHQGSALESDFVDCGACCMPQSMARYQELVDDAVSKGAKVLAGGTLEGIKAQLYPPTVLAGVTEEMRISSEEIFGPIMCIFKVHGNSDTEALRIANESVFGLSGCVHSGSQPRAARMCDQLESGMASVNDLEGTTYLSQSLPFGGQKDSGFGRFAGPEGCLLYTSPSPRDRTRSRMPSSA